MVGGMTDSMKKQVMRVATLSVVSNTILVVLKVIVGILIGSVSVISEAIHSGIDLVAALIAFFAVKESSKPADADHPYGHGKFENVSGTIEAVLIFIAAIWIIAEAIHKLRNPAAIEEPSWGIGVMLISSLVNLCVSQILFRVGKKANSIAIQADAWHLRTDVYTSAGVMFGLLVMWIGAKFFPALNMNWVDPVAAIFVALLIIISAYELTIHAAKDLFDVSLPVEEVTWVANMLRARSDIKSFHHVKTRKSGKDRFFEFHLAVEAQATVAEAHAMTDEVSEAIRNQYPESHITIHIEPCDDRCSPGCRSGCFVKKN